MNTIYNILVLFPLLVVSLLSCSSDKDRVAKEVKALTGRHIVFPEGYMPLPACDSLYADSMHLSVPLLYYDCDVFGRVNELDVLARNKTFLLDRDDNIVLVGEPFYNERLSLLYKRMVKSLFDKYTNNSPTTTQKASQRQI